MNLLNLLLFLMPRLLLFLLTLHILIFHSNGNEPVTNCCDEKRSVIIVTNTDYYSFSLKNSSSSLQTILFSSIQAGASLAFVEKDSFLILDTCNIPRIFFACEAVVNSEGQVILHRISFLFPSYSIQTCYPPILVSCVKSNTSFTHYTSVLIVESVFESIPILENGDTFISSGVHDEQVVEGCCFNNLTLYHDGPHRTPRTKTRVNSC